MTEIIMYTTTYCPYCVKAKELFKRKGITNIKEIDVTNSDSLREEMMQKSGGRKTVPQIFINGKHIGGCDDTYALDSNGELEKLLKSA
jgi:glutaredoxin 3